MVPVVPFLLAMDVDGTLTDGGIYLSSDGSEAKRFDVKDGLALTRFRQRGGIVALISGRKSDVTARRADELGIKHLFNGTRDKLRDLQSLARSLGVPRERVAYVGDDLNDLECLLWAGIGVAVGDAPREVKLSSDWVTLRPGGCGAVRETVERLISEGYC